MASLDPLSSIVTALKRELIIPDIIPESANFYPSVLFSVIYPSGRKGILHTELMIEDALDEPEVNFTPMVASDEFTEDSTSNDSETTNPTSKEFRHWVITGLKAPAQSSDKTGNLTALKTKPSTTPYRPPAFLLFQEPPGFSLPPDAKEFGDSIPERRHWKAFEFGEKYGLKLVGANYFIVRSVDE
ncbi:hypothetical protein K435DRAFT_782152 [Dendrothele bispora CBS 962.96]|uniref:PEBP-like protein n=1 Tax=Dendrothele bispora (strain CBS 962.96) TaxID=1314807 RepID=A0A4S8LGP0_DENBC|nr:hypothetical protein K435DRAFT_782152 [Dendrothele bispora CBS 962.96]